MSQPTHRLEFAPPPTPGLLRSIGLAVLAHGVLIAVLTAGVAWKRDAVLATVEAELWSALPQEAAPAAEAPPEPPLPTPDKPPEPAPQAEPKPEPAPPQRSAADIAQAREKDQQARQRERERLEKQKQDKLKQDREKQEKDRQAREKAQKEQRDKQAAAARQAREARRLEEERQKNIQRMQKMAGGTPSTASASGSGAANSTGSAAQASGPSAGYMGRIVARIKPNIVFTDSVPGNPRAEVEIRVSPTGAILSARITQSSGIKAWDDAVLRAIEKTEMLPKDVDGSVPTSMQIGFRPKD